MAKVGHVLISPAASSNPPDFPLNIIITALAKLHQRNM